MNCVIEGANIFQQAGLAPGQMLSFGMGKKSCSTLQKSFELNES